MKWFPLFILVWLWSWRRWGSGTDWDRLALLGSFFSDCDTPNNTGPNQSNCLWNILIGKQKKVNFEWRNVERGRERLNTLVAHSPIHRSIYLSIHPSIHSSIWSFYWIHLNLTNILALHCFITRLMYNYIAYPHFSMLLIWIQNWGDGKGVKRRKKVWNPQHHHPTTPFFRKISKPNQTPYITFASIITESFVSFISRWLHVVAMMEPKATNADEDGGDDELGYRLCFPPPFISTIVRYANQSEFFQTFFLVVGGARGLLLLLLLLLLQQQHLIVAD